MARKCCWCVVWVVVLVVPLAAWAEELPPWTAKIRPDHPRLFFNADTWPEV